MSARTLRIGIDVQWAKNSNTGIGRYTNKWIALLADLDDEIRYFLFDWGRLDSDVELFRILSTHSNFFYTNAETNLCLLPYKLAVVLYDQWSLPRMAKKYCCSLLFYPYFNASLLCLSRSIITITDLAIYLHHPQYPFARQAYYNFLLRLAAKRALALVAISESTKRDIIYHLGVSEDRIHVVYPGVSEQFRPVNRNEAKQWCASHYDLKKPFVLYTGGYAIRKNITRMLAAFARAHKQIGQEVQLVLTGDALNDPAVVSYLANGRERNLILVGKVSEDHLPTLYSAAEAVLYVSLYEGFGLPVVEAQACGTPVITSNVSSMPEVAGDAALLVNPLDEEAMATAIVKVLSDEGLREHLKERGLKNARRFTWRAGAEKLLALFRYYGGRSES